VALCGLPALLAAAGAGQAARPDGAQEALPPKTGGVYRRPLDNDPRTLDAAFVSNIYSFSVIQQLFEGLVQYDATAGTRPGLAQSWKASHSTAGPVSLLSHGVTSEPGHPSRTRKYAV